MVECYYIKRPIGLRSISSSFDFSGHTSISSHTSKPQSKNNENNQNEIPSIFCSACRRHVLRIYLRCRTVCKTIVTISRPRRRRRPQQAWPVRFSLLDRPVRRITIVASPYAATPYVASPYAASPYVASSYVASPYAAAPYVASHHPYGAVSSYATYPYVAKTFASPYAYYP
ncbi:unnamed protein product [Macrosiphum euphorbiae]|nr:unnamed protein product [Macrosiphum euphorbiae]